ncbi:MAG TPA: response regulator [Geothrix sp.]
MDASHLHPSEPGPPSGASGEHLLTLRLAESAEAQRRLAEGIYALSLASTSEEVFQVLLAQAAAVLPGPRWFLGRAREDGGLHPIMPAAGPSPLPEGLGLSILDSGFTREVLDHRRLCVVEVAAASPAMISPALVQAHTLRALLGIPLVFEGRLMGVLFAVGFQGEAVATLRDSDIAVLQSLAHIAALALERLQAEARLERAARLSRDLARGMRDLAGAVDEDILVAHLFQWAARLVPLPEWWFNRYDPATRSCLTTHWTPGVEAFGTPEVIRGPDSVEGNPLLERIHLHQQAVHLPRWEDVPEAQGERAWPGPLHTWVGVPLAHEGTVAGSLSGGSFGEQGHIEIPAEGFEALRSLAEAAGLAMNRLQARQALEAQETRFRLLFEQSPDPTVLLARGVVQQLNKAALELFGYPASALQGASPLKLSPVMQPSGSSSEEAAMRFLTEVKAGDRNRFEWTFLHMSGRELICEVGITQYLLGTQRIYHAVLHDITEQKRAEGERAALERQLFQAQKMESLGVLAGGIAHDFNNLLMGVLGHAGLALEQLNPLHPAKRNLEAIQKAGQRAADLTRQMLAYSGRGQFVVGNLDLSAQVEEMLHLLEVSLPKTVVLNLSLGKALPAVLADASQIQQVIMNLVINAAEAIGEAPGAITLATGSQHVDEATARTMLVGQDVKPGTYVFLEITDTGCGMDPDTISRIFEPFFTTKFTGRGLGLSAIMGIVRGHKGALRIYSEMGHGTTFKVLLPALGMAAEAPAIPAAEQVWAGRGLVLVVDDDETVRAVARQALELKGFRVLEAQDGQEAVDLVREQGPVIRVVLLDMTMPRMSGEEAFREMRRIHPDIPVILSSGYNEVEAMGRFMGKGLKGFIQKPYGPRELLAKIQDILES